MEQAKTKKSEMYDSVVQKLFFDGYKDGLSSFEFEREAIAKTAAELNVPVPKNLGDVVYSYKYRKPLPADIRLTAPSGLEWRLVNVGRARYRFALGKEFRVAPNASIVAAKIPNATPGMISKYALSDEQALLAILRYNRLIDMFLGVTCYSLQSHLRTSVRPDPEDKATMQIEVDEVYIGVDGEGAHYIIPVQAKGGNDKIAIQQIEQDMLLCSQQFPTLKSVPIAAQFMSGGGIALFAFAATEDGARVVRERHYRLVGPNEVNEEDLFAYAERSTPQT